MTYKEIKPNIFAVGAQDPDRKLFDALIPLPFGTSYNAYLVKGSDKVALLDTVDPPKVDVLIANLKELGINHLDYIIAHHAEQDHSGSIPMILDLYPEAKVVTNERCQGMLMDHLLIPADKFTVIKDRETLSLGDKTLQFIFAPWVHWPETMFSYIKEAKIIFTCDFLGSHCACPETFVPDQGKVYFDAKRYYAEIMMPFRTSIKSHLATLAKIDFDLVATSHGPIYDQPQFIINAYQDWVSDQVKNEVVLPYVSMHGTTAEMVNYLKLALERKNLKVKVFDLASADLGELAMALVDAATIILGTPTVLAGAHPKAVYAAFLVNALRPKTRYISLIGSYGWGGKVVEQITSLLPAIKAEILEPVLIKGFPRQDGYKKLDGLVEAIWQKHQQDSLVIKTILAT